MKYELDAPACQDLEISEEKEWLLTNGIGGFAMGTGSLINSRRYHGLLIAATDPPATRMRLLASIEGWAEAGGARLDLSTNRYQSAVCPSGYQSLCSFEVSDVAVWRFEQGPLRVVRTVELANGENAVAVRYSNESESAVTLKLRPLVCHQFYHGDFYRSDAYPEALSVQNELTTISHQGVTLYLRHPGAQASVVRDWYYRFEYRREIERGLNGTGDLFCPCELVYELAPGGVVSLTADCGSGTVDFEGGSKKESEGGSSELLLPKLRQAAEKYLIHAASRETVIAGYPWFTDWGRDTMIALPGLCLCTGRTEMARNILVDFSKQMFQGLIPNRFVEAGEAPQYNTVDATLWFVNAVYKTLAAEWNQEFAETMHPVIEEIHRWHVKGTLFEIQVDPDDGLLAQRQSGVQCTWMDAKIGDWVVTPRNGKPVEICALWINALRVLEWLSTKLGKESTGFAKEAERAEVEFERKFWNPDQGCYFDVIEPNDPSVRPNQVLAMCLPFSPANGENAKKALGVVARDLLTPKGLRTLSPEDPAYKGRFRGPLDKLDAAYHQGTVWPWLLGPYATALSRNGFEGAAKVLLSAGEMLTDRGLDGIAEVYDGDEPRQAAGCPWQAWSVGEILRALAELSENLATI